MPTHPVPPPKRVFPSPPSRVVYHATLSHPNKSIPTLALSLGLARKIQSLILTSRTIQSLATDFSAGVIHGPVAAQQLQNLEPQYEMLRETVENELERAWVEAGWVSELLPRFPDLSQIQRRLARGDEQRDIIMGDANYHNGGRCIKRKSETDVAEHGHHGYKNKKNAKKNTPDHLGGWAQPTFIEPENTQRPSTPLRYEDKANMRQWTLGNAWKGGYRDNSELGEEVSPRGTVFGL